MSAKVGELNQAAKRDGEELVGLTHATVKLTSLARTGEPYEADFLVDTGAWDTLAPAPELLRAGIEIEGKQTYQLANGESEEFDIGFARLAFLGSETICKVFFGPPGIEPALGVLALEGVNVIVDPRSQTLRRLQYPPLK